MNAKLQMLQNEGVDIEDAMNRFLNDEELYLQCFQDFMNGDEFILIQKAVESNDVEEAFRQAHTLKGVAGNLSLGPLYRDIVEALRVKDTSKLDLQLQAILDGKTKLENIIK